MIAPEATSPEPLTDDALGALSLLQHRHGYRFTMDAPLLAAFALEGSDERPLAALDIGTGCGVIALLLKHRRPAWTLHALELQQQLTELARRNAGRNGLDVTVQEGDVRSSAPERQHQLVVCNPPYFDAAAGRSSPSGEKALARHDLYAPIDVVAAYARRALTDNGRMCLVYPASRLVTAIGALTAARLMPVRLRCVHPSADAPAGVTLIEARPRSRRPLTIEPPLIAHDADGRFTEPLQAMLRLAGCV